jgi:hypothetical protein
MLHEESETGLTDVLRRLEQVLEKADRLLSAQLPARPEDAFDSALAFVWQRRGEHGRFRPVRHVDRITLADLIGIDGQLHKLIRNTKQFLRGAPANHVLLWGERGTGKSSAVKALLHEYASDGLRLVQVHRQDLLDLPEITEQLWDRPEKFILFCDALSFEADDLEYKELKAMLEGGLHAQPKNLLIYATSNRRHLITERMADRQVVVANGEIHANDALSEQLSLADRFGLRLGFYAIDQQTYLRIVRHLAAARGLPVDDETLEREALRWAMAYSGRSGRSARQFVDDLQGRLALEE